VDKPLVVVESPTKVRTIKKYLGNDYNVVATVGHIMDLPSKEIGIDIEQGFKPKYETIPGKQKVISSLKKAAGKATVIYLAPDPDREGEAIAFHTAEVLKKKGRKFYRVLFHELTRNAIQEAISTPEQLNEHKYEAQKARRILDRLVGYQISPLLWKKVQRGLSAGRVQSVTVRIICERERSIQAFESEEYWSVTAHLEGDVPPEFQAKLVRKNGKKVKITDQLSADTIVKALTEQPFTVDKIISKTTKRNPLPPFITSKLQQESIRKLRFSAKKAMIIAQQLYEGIDLGPGEPEGLITYMRTDSTRIAAEAAEEALELIRSRYGNDYAIDKPRDFKNKKKVQDAHECIRPTSVLNTPEQVAPYLDKDQLALYTLIWQRFISSQMKQALINQSSLLIKADDCEFTASGSTIAFPGFMILYLSEDDKAKSQMEKDKGPLPPLAKGQVLNLNQLVPKQHFTAPPPRFSEASLVKELEENGIGRPSTYASILSTIRDKGYVDLIKSYFKPNELGFIVNDLLVESFSDIFNVNFTSKMEDDLDKLESAEEDTYQVLTRFYTPFKTELDAAAEGMLSVKGVGVPTSLKCPKCNATLHIKMGRNGAFMACSSYPECTFTGNYLRDEKGQLQVIETPPDQVSDQVCEKCGKPMVIKTGRYGQFLACSGYPDCKNARSLSSNGQCEDTGVNCPEPGCDGKLVQKSSKRGKIFYGCNRYPDCKFATWEKPIPRKCPQCGADFLVEKTTKKTGTSVHCLNKECGFKEKA